MGDVDRRVEAAAKAIAEELFEPTDGDDVEFCMDAARAALAAVPSALDRLAAWADEHNVSVDIVRATYTADDGTLTPWAVSVQGAGTDFDADVQVAAERVLTRLEEKADG